MSDPFHVLPTMLFPLWNHDAGGTDTGKSITPLGFVMNQNRMSVPVWSYAMEHYPPARIIEIGSYNGGLLCALGVHAYNIKAKCYGFDVTPVPGDDYKALAGFLGIQFYTMDCFSTEAMAFIKQLISEPGVTYLLCDGGNKMKELSTFAPYLKSGDVIAGHDYHCNRDDWWPFGETHPARLKDLIERENLTPFYQQYFDTAGWLALKKS